MFTVLSVRIVSIAIITALCMGAQASKQPACEVSVEQPWQSNTYVPQGSSVEISCSGGENQTAPTWSIYLPDSPQTLRQFSFKENIELLNDRGFYQNKSNISNTIHLLLNYSEGINKTAIQCDDLSTATRISRTIIIVVEPYRIEMQTHDATLPQMVKISWSPILHHSHMNYTLRVTSSNTEPQSYQLHTSSFNFSAPEGAPACEVYNFSVTASYVGATYTGAGCSELSPVISRMLPSLPDKVKLDSSIVCVLERNESGKISIRISMLPIIHYCEEFPVLNYTLVAVHKSQTQTFSLRNESLITLSDNNVYRFNVLASNIVGQVKTDTREIYTTDVQMVRAVQEKEGKAAFRVSCDFITGSNAKGCVVVLVSAFHNTTVNVMRRIKTNSDNSNGTDAELVVSLDTPPLCYEKVFGYDIESDETLGQLAVPGVIMISQFSSESSVQCSSPVDTSPPGFPRLFIVLIGGLTFLIVLLMIIIIIVLCVCACKMKRRFKTDDLKHLSLSRLHSDSTQPVLSKQVYSPEPIILPVYETPTTLNHNRKTSEKSGDESTDYSKTAHCNHKTSQSETDVDDDDGEDYAKLQENFYHVLECGESQCSPEHTQTNCLNGNYYEDPEVFTTFKTDSQTSEENPIYQEITGYQDYRRGRINQLT